MKINYNDYVALREKYKKYENKKKEPVLVEEELKKVEEKEVPVVNAIQQKPKTSTSYSPNKYKKVQAPEQKERNTLNED